MEPSPSSAPCQIASFRKLFFTGVITWVLGSAAIFGGVWLLKKPETFFDGLMWTLGYWWIAFALGFVALVARAVLDKAEMGAALLAYLLPVVLVGGTAGLCLAIYPDTGFREDLMAFFPLVLIFYVLGSLWMRIRKEERDPFVRAVVPPITAGLLILAFVAIPVFTSYAFIYRDAFGLTTVKTLSHEGGLVVEAILEIRKPGQYQFVTPQFDIGSFGMFPQSDPNEGRGQVTWGAAGEPKDGATGNFPLKIRWPKFAQMSQMYMMPELMNPAILEVRNREVPSTVIYMVAAPFSPEMPLIAPAPQSGKK